MKKKLNLIIYFIFLILYLELIYKHFILHNVLSYHTLLIVLFSTSFAVLFTLLSSLGKPKTNRIISIILSIFITLIYISQYVYYKFYNSIYSVFSVIKGTEQVFGGFFSSILIMIKNNILVIIIMLLPLILFIILGKKIFNYNKSKLNNIILSIAFIILFLVKSLIIIFSNNGMYSLHRLYFETHAPMLLINKTGLLSMEVMDVERFIFGFDEKFEISKETSI